MPKGLLIRGATILDPHAPMRRADIRIADGLIVEIAEGLRPDGEEELDAHGKLATPGLINAHTHSGQSLARGTAPNLPLDLWMVWTIYGGFEPSAEDAYTTAAAGAIEMLRSGCTAVLDQVYVPVADVEAQTTAVMEAYADVGIRAAVAPMLQDRNFLESLALDGSPDAQASVGLSPNVDPAELARALARFIDMWQGKDSNLMPMLGPTAPQRCSDRFLEMVADLAKERRVRIHTHLLEAKTQRIAALKRYGRSIVEHLRDLGYLAPHVSFAHAVWLTPDEYEAIHRAGAVLVHNPVSNLRCGSGVMPLQHLLRLGMPVAMGTDGAASNDAQNMFETLKIASLMHTLYGNFRQWPQPVDLWETCLLGGAAALGQRLGQIQPGFHADIVLLSLDRHVLAPKDHLVASLVHSDHGDSVDTVVVGGRVVVRDGVCTRINESAIRTRGLDHMARSVISLDRRRRIYATYEAAVGASIDHAAPDPMESTQQWRGREGTAQVWLTPDL